jgi:lipopolysaccharide/colanic/teichoic acid biosynthesis glycosyltransferase
MYRQVKRALDFFAALIALIVLSPLMLFVSVLIFLCEDGSVLFRQERPGKNCKVFTVYKFRTMKTKTVENGIELSDMERMTKLGKTLRALSIDELPQLINVLKGEMSFIGPRPLLTEYIDRYNSYQMRRHEVLPGITGWAQVNGRNTISWDEKFQLDVWYVDNMSFTVDLKISFRTIRNIFRREGVNCNKGVTMEHFKGNKETANIN